MYRPCPRMNRAAPPARLHAMTCTTKQEYRTNQTEKFELYAAVTILKPLQMLSTMVVASPRSSLPTTFVPL